MNEQETAAERIVALPDPRLPPPSCAEAPPEQCVECENCPTCEISRDGLEHLKLKELGALTDQGCNRLYAEMAGVKYFEAKMNGLELVDDESPNVCRPDCPADILEGLPGLVEKWTGRKVEMMIHHRDPVRFVYFYNALLANACASEQGKLHQFASNNPGRHLPHACLLAALAACIVYGRAAE